MPTLNLTKSELLTLTRVIGTHTAASGANAQTIWNKLSALCIKVKIPEDETEKEFPLGMFNLIQTD